MCNQSFRKYSTPPVRACQSEMSEVTFGRTHPFNALDREDFLRHRYGRDQQRYRSRRKNCHHGVPTTWGRIFGKNSLIITNKNIEEDAHVSPCHHTLKISNSRAYTPSPLVTWGRLGTNPYYINQLRCHQRMVTPW
jgi:hypothetical protein